MDMCLRNVLRRSSARLSNVRASNWTLSLIYWTWHASASRAKRTSPAESTFRAVLNDVIDLMQARVESKALALTCEVADEPLAVMATGDHIRQLWTNLISNAIKYTPDKGRIGWFSGREGDMVRGQVRDTGHRHQARRGRPRL